MDFYDVRLDRNEDRLVVGCNPLRSGEDNTILGLAGAADCDGLILVTCSRTASRELLDFIVLGFVNIYDRNCLLAYCGAGRKEGRGVCTECLSDNGRT